MKRILIILILFISFSTPVLSQRGPRGRGSVYRERVVRRSIYRPARIVVFRPYWGPNIAFRRRWVYFPYYNFYWDNWRNHYLFWNGSVWISQPVQPAGVQPEKLSSEKKKELKEEEDDVDDVYKSNDVHKNETKDQK